MQWNLFSASNCPGIKDGDKYDGLHLASWPVSSDDGSGDDCFGFDCPNEDDSGNYNG